MEMSERFFSYFVFLVFCRAMSGSCTIEIESFSPCALVEEPKSSLNLTFRKKRSLIFIVGPDKDSPRFIEF